MGGETVNKILEEKKNSSAHTFEELKERYKKSLSAKNSPLHQAKLDTQDSRVERRFRLVSQKRAININNLEEWPENDPMECDTEATAKESLFRLYDVVSEDGVEDKTAKKIAEEGEKITCNGVEMIREFVNTERSESDPKYVYDLYYTRGQDKLEQGDFDDSLLDGLVSIQPFNTGDDLLYDEYREDEFKYEDDEDSNDEDNEKNEYPDDDEEEDSSYKGYGEEDYLDLDMKVKGLGLDTDEENSNSSDEEDQLLYTRAFDNDAACHGSAYARFKQRMVREFYQGKGVEEGDDDDDEDFADDD